MLCSCSLVLPVLVTFGSSSAPCPQSLMFKQGARCGCVVPTLAPRGGILPFCGERRPGLARQRHSTFQDHRRRTGTIKAWAQPKGPNADGPRFYRGDLSDQPTLRFWENMAVSGLGVGRPLFWGPGGAQWGAAEAVGWGRQEPARGPPLLV